MTTDVYDAIIVGGGHNGLICAAYLARAGRTVLVLERRHVLGGAAVTEELHPGFKFSVCSYVVSLFRPQIIRDLDLARHGFELIPLESSFTPLPDGRSLCRWPDPHRTRREIAKFSESDADRLQRDGYLQYTSGDQNASLSTQVGGSDWDIYQPRNEVIRIFGFKLDLIDYIPDAQDLLILRKPKVV